MVKLGFITGYATGYGDSRKISVNVTRYSPEHHDRCRFSLSKLAEATNVIVDFVDPDASLV